MPRSLLYVNNWSTVITQQLLAGSGTVYLAQADIDRLPAVSVINKMAIKLTLSDAGGNVEIVEAVSKGTGNLSIFRNREGTLARDWPIGTKIEANLTAESLRASNSGRLWTTYEVSATSDPNVTGFLEENRFFHLMLSRNVTIWLTTDGNDPNGDTWTKTVIVEQNGTGNWGVIWQNVRWPGGTAPVMTATPGAIDVYEFYRPNGYASWLGLVKGQNL